MKINLQFQSLQNFFGPVHSWRERFLEESFALQMHLNMSYTEIRNLPTRYRIWYLNRLKKHYEKQSEMYNRSPNSGKTNKDNMEGFDKFNQMIDKKFSS